MQKTPSPAASCPRGLPGGRIRARRLERGLSQAALARAAEISPSYLNLIEHGRRNVGGRLLLVIAEQLDCDVSLLSRGAEAGLSDRLRRIGAGAGLPASELGRADEFAESFPGWARQLATGDERIATLERAVAELSDRLSHDPVLSASVHDVLSVVTAIRSTSAILVDDPDLAPEWQGRFHRNLYEDSQRLAHSAQRLVAFLSAGGAAAEDVTTPHEEMEAWLVARAFHVAELERPGTAPDALARALPDGPGRALLERHLARYADDARALPLPMMIDALERHGPDPFALASATGAALPRVLRRLASLPEALVGGPVGLALCDGSGALTFRRPVAGFDLPRFGAACPLWPLVQALLRPQAPLATSLRQPGRSARPFRAWATATLAQPAGYDGPLVAEATMLLVPADILPPGTPDRTGPERAVGTTCRLCPIAGCPARREKSILPEEAGPAAF